jgi:hypothetical protein
MVYDYSPFSTNGYLKNSGDDRRIKELEEKGLKKKGLAERHGIRKAL